MRKIANPHLAQLQMQLKFTSPKMRREYLQAAEQLLDLIEPDKQYPFDFVCFKITGYHPKDLPHELISGAQLADDLGLFLWKLSGLVDDPVSEHDEQIYTIDQLAHRLNISTKTIARWRRRGLRARKYVFSNGAKRLAVSQSGIDKFIAENRDLAGKAAAYSRLDKKQTDAIISQAKKLAAGGGIIRREAIEQIAEKTGRGRETIRAIIEQYEQSAPGNKPFKTYDKSLDSTDKSEIYKLYKKDVRVSDIAERFKRTKSEIYRIIKRKRAEELLAVRIEFVPSDEFLTDDAEQIIIGGSIAKLRSPKLHLDRKQMTVGSLKKYLDNLKSIPRLTRDREADLFRKYNYLKFRAAQAQQQLHPARVSSRQLNFIDKCLRHAEAVKNTIIEANLSLVVGIAGKHTTTGAALQDLISEGNFSLMRAVEKFDYTKGFRLATYASWIIAKDFARKVPADTLRPDKGGADALDNIQRDLRVTEGVDFGAIERARHSLVQVIKNELDEREQYVILHHYGLTGSPIIKKTKTLQEIGDELKLSRERIRQLELSALQKLKQSLSIEEFELLTG
jgi:RNA polymerase sigma factor (sigma-70 family)